MQYWLPLTNPEANVESLVGQTFHDKYRIGELIGRGGMGAVYRAEHVVTGRPVAVKTILPRLLIDTSAVERFRREARAAGSLRHPNIVDVTDFGVARVGDQEVAYLVMEYLEGSTLRALIEKSGALRLEVVVEIVEQVAIALDTAHHLGIVHRDLKPDNIWLIPDPRGGHVVRILDFGIAKLRDPGSSVRSGAAVPPAPPGIGRRAIEIRTEGALDLGPTLPLGRGEGETAIPTVETSEGPPATPDHQDGSGAPTIDLSGPPSPDASPLTELGATLGTPAYMSPEQCRGEPVDARSDIYSLGLIAWQALAGRHPFEGTARDLIGKQLRETPPRVDEVNPAVPRRVGEAISVATAKSPDERYVSAGAMAGSIRVASEGPTVILRRSLALYLERFAAFFRISVRSAAPFLPIVVFEIIGIALAWLGLHAWGGGQTIAQRPVPYAFLLAVVIFVNIALWGWITATHHAAFSSVVKHLRSRPLDEIDVEMVFSDLKRLVGLETSASLNRTLRKLVAYYLKLDSRAPAWKGDMAFQVAFHEERDPDEVFDRCVTLCRPTRLSQNSIRAFIYVGMLLPLAVEGSFLFAVGSFFRLQPIESAYLAMLGAVILIPFNAILINPGISPSLAVLYFHARQALGEGVGLSAVMPSRL